MRQPRAERESAPAVADDAARSGAQEVESTALTKSMAQTRGANAGRDRLAAVGLLLLVLALAYAIGLHWWWTSPMLDMGRQMQDLREQELRLRMLALQRPQIEKRLAMLRQSQTDNPAFLPEASAELAQAGLTQRIDSEVSAVSPDHGGCNISQRTPVASTVPERYQRVDVQVHLLCGMNEFAGLLHSLESGRPQLFVTNLNIIGRSNGIGANGVPESNGAMDVTFDIYGYLRPGIVATAPNANGDGDAQP